MFRNAQTISKVNPGGYIVSAIVVSATYRNNTWILEVINRNTHKYDLWVFNQYQIGISILV